MFHILHFILSIITIIILSIIISNNRKKIRIKFIIQLFIIEIIIAYLLFNSEIGTKYILYSCDIFNKLLFFAKEGINFIFGNMNKQELAFFFLNILCPIIFISTIIGILKYIKILHYAIQIIGTILSKINGMGKLESFNAISSIILGQSENFISYKNILDKISEKRIYTMAATSMSTVSISIIGAYITMLTPKYVISALILNIFSSFIILSIVNPYQINKENDIKISFIYNKKQNFFEMIEEYMTIGVKIIINVTTILIGFIALISASNALFNTLFGISFQEILGYIFIPIIWIIGIPANELLKVSSIMAIKLISNEFIAMIELQKIIKELSPHSIGILSVFLVSFANFSSIAIIAGSIAGLNKNTSTVIYHHGLKLIYSATLINLLSATITSFVI